MRMLIAWMTTATVLACLSELARRPAFGQATQPADLADALDRAVQRTTLGGWWGAVVVVKDGQTIEAKGYGFRDESLAPIDADSLFDIGSVSKQFTAATLLRLQSHGVLSIDDVVAKFFPGVGGRSAQVTLRHLLTHTSGLSDRAGALQPLAFENRDEAVRLAMNSPPIGDPGERFEYCNGGYVVLAAVIEVATGRSFESVARNEVFQPAGLTQTGFLDGLGLDPAHATVRSIGAGTDQPRRVSLFASKTGEPWAWGLRGAGGVVTTLNDWARWDAALRSNVVLDERSRALLFAPDKDSYAMGWRVEQTADGTRRISHGGSTRGYSCEVVHYPEDHVGIAVFTNEAGIPWTIVQAIEGVLFPQRAERIQATLRLSQHPMNQDRLAKFDTKIRWTAATIPSGDSHAWACTLMLGDEKNHLIIAEFKLSRGSARTVVSQIGALNITGAGPTAEDAQNNSTATVQLALLRHEPDEHGGVTITGEPVRIMVMPEYRGQDAQGHSIVDARPTLVLVDPATSMWPLIVTMSQTKARELAAVLQTAVPSR